MSEIMWNDPKFRRNWKEISVHDDKNVRGFFGEYKYLSNFWPCLVEFEGLIYPTSEHAFQAAKVSPQNRQPFTDLNSMSAEESKQAWKPNNIWTKPRWDEARYDIMARVVFSKFMLNPELRAKLIDTAGKYLEETLWWKDTYWGYDINLKKGENKLGEILMMTRTYWLASKFNVVSSNNLAPLKESHVCTYSKAMNQPFPRKCIHCGKEEPTR